VKLTKLRLQNYRCYQNFEIDLHEKLTVLIAPNGFGKTTLLDAARVALWPFVKGFDLGSQTGKSATIQNTDVRLALLSEGNMEPQLPCIIKACGDWSSSERDCSWTQQRISMKKSTNTTGDVGSRALTGYGKELEELVRRDQQVTLPLLSYLGTSRLWFEGRFTSVAAEATLDKSEYSRTSGYLNCLSYSSSFKTFTAWFGWIYRSYREEQLTALERNSELSSKGLRFSQIIEAIKASINTLIEAPTGWRDLEYSASHQQQLVMHHPVQGVMPVDMLSDGLRNAIAMVADLAFRACKLNPHFGERAPLETPGIALIDEVDMFLHPQWQQTILASLQSAFPEIQFIVTTHSPQVLSTVRRESIRVVEQTESGLGAVMPEFSPLAHESGDALAKIMGTHREPPLPIQEQIRHFEQLVRAGQESSDLAKALRDELDQAGYQIHESDLVTWRFLAKHKAVQGGQA